MTIEKLEELMLYISHKSHDDETFSSTKLNKLLFIADFYAYGIWEKSITGTKYVRRQFGPVPSEVLIAQDKLIANGKAKIEERSYFERTQKRLVPLANPDLTLFSTEEIHLIHAVMDECKPLNATQLSDWTHKLRPWLDSADGEELPYYTIFVLREVPVSYDDITWAQSKLKELTGMDYAS